MTAPADTNSAPEEMPKTFIRLWLLALVLISLFIRVHGADEFYYNPDEAMHIGMAKGETLAEVSHYSLYETHPPLGNYIRHYWLMLSDTPAFARDMSLLCGILLILLYYRIGRLANGELTGLCCSALIAFSHGCIIQSYIVRNYAVFVLFLSLSFHDYLRWRKQDRNTMPIGYGLWSTLACLTHFSGIFFVACIGGYEMLVMHKRKASYPQHGRWLLANGIATFAAATGYVLWQPVLAPLHHPFFDEIFATPQKLALCTLFSPLATGGYILSNYSVALVLLLGMAWVAIARPAFIRNKAGMNSCLALTGVFFALQMTILATGTYPVLGTQRSLWTLPVYILPAGWIIADLCALIEAKLSKRIPALSQVMALLLFGAAAATYNPAERFTDRNYIMKQSDWQALTGYFQKLGSADLIVAQRSDGTLVRNPYPFFDQSSFTALAPVIRIPFGTTHVLIDEFYPHEYNMTALPDMIQAAQTAHLLEGKDRLVFFTTGWSVSHLTDLAHCPALDKEIVTFPRLGPDENLTVDSHISAALLIVPKQRFLDDVLSPQGKAYGCLEAMRAQSSNTSSAAPTPH